MNGGHVVFCVDTLMMCMFRVNAAWLNFMFRWRSSTSWRRR